MFCIEESFVSSSTEDLKFGLELSKKLFSSSSCKSSFPPSTTSKGFSDVTGVSKSYERSVDSRTGEGDKSSFILFLTI